MEEKISAALAVAEAWSTIDGAHHKQWIIDQMIRALTGDGYDEWVLQYNGNEEETDEWNVGIAP